MQKEKILEPVAWSVPEKAISIMMGCLIWP